MMPIRIGYGSSVFEPIAFLSEPDTLGIRRYLDVWRGTGYLQPEKRLMFAVLQDAIECFQNHKFEQRAKVTNQFLDTERWIFLDDREWPFSFLNICEAVGIDSDYLRKGLLRWKERAGRKLMVKDNQESKSQPIAAKQ
jgi:hypothetical protein